MQRGSGCRTERGDYEKECHRRAGTAFALVGALALAGCSGSSAPRRMRFRPCSNPSDPVQVELWTYYNGTQQQAFEDLVKDFNATKGKDLASW